MGQIKITGPDGRSLALNAPDGASEDQIMAKINEIKANWGSIPHPDTVQTTATGAFRLASGRPHSDSVTRSRPARVLSMIKPSMAARLEMHTTATDETRARVRASADQHPVAYYGGEIGGALAVPGGLAGLACVARSMPAANQGFVLASRLAQRRVPPMVRPMASERVKDRRRGEGAAGGAAVGGAFGAAAPGGAVWHARALEPVRNRYNSVFNPTEEAARRVALAQDADNQAIQSATIR